MKEIQQKSLFENTYRLNMLDSIQLTIDSLNAYGSKYDNWVIAWTGDEPLADEPFEQIFQDGSVQKLLFSPK